MKKLDLGPVPHQSASDSADESMIYVEPRSDLISDQESTGPSWTLWLLIKKIAKTIPTKNHTETVIKEQQI